MKTGTYTTGTGATFTIRPIPPYTIEHYRLSFQQQFDDTNPPIERPTYRVETAGGGFEVHPHDEATIETPEERAAFDAWTEYNDQRNAFVNTKILDVMIVEGVDADPAADPAWLKRKKFFSTKLPDDEIELKLFYVREHLVLDQTDGGDFAGLPEAMSSLLGVSQSAVAASKATFRGKVRQTGRRVARSAHAAQEAGEMVHEPAIHGDRDGEGVGLDAEPVG